MRERLSLMNADDLREVVFNIYRRNPSHVLDVLQPTPQGGGGHHPQQGGDVPSWCTCTFCKEMPSEEERVCCGETQHNCHSRLRDFDTIVLDELVLEIARRYRNDVLAQPEDENYNRSNRYAAYRQFILWTYGHLGAGNRRIIPSCCVWKIRDKYPDPFGQYVGFTWGRLG